MRTATSPTAGDEVELLVELRRVEALAKAMRNTNKPVKWCRASASFGTGKTLQSKA